KSTSVHVADLPAPLDVSGSWELRFPPKWGAPESVTLDHLASWTTHSDPGVKYFSGTATYMKDFDVPAELPGRDRRIFLDLGAVKNLAEVTLNGTDLGVLWKPPFRAEITGCVKPGGNHLEVKLTNLWPNRMIGDQTLPESK